MNRFSNRIVRWGVLAAMACGANFQLASCNIEENGVVGGFADLLGLSDLHLQLLESSPFHEFFERLGEGFGDLREEPVE